MKDALGHGSNAHSSGVNAAVPTEYEAAKAHGQMLEAASKQAGAEINKFPRGPMGLTPDDVKATPEWKAARANSDRTFAALRAHNQYMVKTFKKEMKADRAKRYGR